MRVVFDQAKDEINRRKHGVSLAAAAELRVLAVVEDRRVDYGERRFNGYGLIEDVGYCLTFTLRARSMRAISLRRARNKEMRRYVF